jgi:hypothetical protein
MGATPVPAYAQTNAMRHSNLQLLMQATGRRGLHMLYARYSCSNLLCSTNLSMLPGVC